MGLAIVVASLAGAGLWTATEYGLHRFAGHDLVRRRPGRFWWLTPRVLAITFYEEHIAHHRDPSYFPPWWMKALAALAIVPLVGGAAALWVGPQVGLASGGGFALTYLAYELLHRRVHTRAPANRYLRWMRRHHLHHHVALRTNHGVTSPLWDHVFGTVARPARVRLHRRLAPPWLLDEAGELRPGFAEDYEILRK
jgi:sterol desaturase/sphingolipid hydroxylase (fatty acid hydroxylase superfamily)